MPNAFDLGRANSVAELAQELLEAAAAKDPPSAGSAVRSAQELLDAIRARAALDAIDLASSWRERGEFGRAKAALEECPPERRALEWRILRASLDDSLAGLAISGLQRAWFIAGSDAIVVQSNDAVRIFDGSTLRCTSEFGAEVVVACAPCGRRALVRDGGKYVIRVDGASIEIGTSPTGDPPCAAFSEDGTVLAIVWSWQSGELRCGCTGEHLRSLQGPFGRPRSLRFNRAATSVISVDSTAGWMCWRVSTGAQVPQGGKTAAGSRGWLPTWASDTEVLDSSLSDASISLWDEEGCLKRRLPAFMRGAPGPSEVFLDDRVVVSLAKTAQGAMLRCASLDVEGAATEIFVGRPNWRPTVLAKVDSQLRCAVGDLSGAIGIFEVAPEGDIRPCGELLGHEHGIESLAWRSDGRRLVSTSTDGTLRIWDVSDETWRGDRSVFESEEHAAGRARLRSIHGGPGGEYKWFVGRADAEEFEVKGLTGPLSEVAFARTADVFAAVDLEGRVLRVSYHGGRVLLEELSRDERYRATDVAIRSDGSVVAVAVAGALEQRPVVAIEFHENSEMRIANGHYVRLDSSFDRVASWSLGSAVEVLRFDSGDKPVSIRPPVSGLKEVAFSADGEAVAIAGCTRTASDNDPRSFVGVWCSSTGELGWSSMLRRLFPKRVEFVDGGARVMATFSPGIALFDAGTGALVMEDPTVRGLPNERPRRVRAAEALFVAAPGAISPSKHYRRECLGDLPATWLSQPMLAEGRPPLGGLSAR